MRKLLYAVIAACLVFNVWANDFFTASGVPSTGAALNSATMRGEFSAIEDGFDKMPGLTGNGNKVVTVNAGGTALTATASTALSGMVIGTNLQAWDADLDALAALAATAGMVSRTGAGAFIARTITGTSAEIDVANGTGASGAPTISLPTSLQFAGKTITGGTFSSTNLASPTMTSPTLGSASATSISFSSTSGVIGTVTNNSAAAGSVGEHLSVTVLTGDAISLTTDTPANVATLELTAGDWDVWVNGYFNGGATTGVTYLLTSISTTSATLNQSAGRFGLLAYAGAPAVFNASNGLSVSAGPVRISVNVATTVYFVAQAGFGTSTCSAWGIIQARRRR